MPILISDVLSTANPRKVPYAGIRTLISVFGNYDLPPNTWTYMKLFVSEPEHFAWPLLNVDITPVKFGIGLV